MTYDFKRLADVEELSEAPENAKALIEVDGDIKRAPAGGGGNAILEDMIFDLDVDYTSSGKAYLSDMDQVKRAYDNNMNIYANYFADLSGIRYSYFSRLSSIKDTAVISSASGKSYLTVMTNDLDLNVTIDTNELSNQEIVPLSAYLDYHNSSYTLVRVYASIF